jgi:hypothetical protein
MVPHLDAGNVRRYDCGTDGCEKNVPHSVMDFGDTNLFNLAVRLAAVNSF